MMSTAAAVFLTACALAQSTGSAALWTAPKSTESIPHFQTVNGHQVLYVDDEPYSMLAVEIPWWDLRAGHYQEDETVYDGLYAKAKELGVNTLKVPVKWSMIEPEKDQYDFSYVDHAIKMASAHHLHLVLDWFGHYASGDGNIYGNLTGEMYAPRYIIEDDKTYPRAVDREGVVHHNAISYDSEAFIARELKAFRAFVEHLRRSDTQHIVVGIQLENEISIFGADRHNPSFFRNHTEEANRRFQENHFSDDLKFSAWDLSTHWIRPLTQAEHEIYPIPIFHNYVGGTTEPGLLGGSPGEDVNTYLENCPDLSFIAVNAYFCSDWKGTSCPSTSAARTEELRSVLNAYSTSRNIPAVTEANSGASPVAPRFAYLALGEFGVPIFAPWSLTVSYPESFQPYVSADGHLGNGAEGLRDAYTSLTMALPQILLYAGTDKLGVFQAPTSGVSFSDKRNLNGLEVDVSGSHDGQAIVIHPSPNQLLVVGYRVNVSLPDPEMVWPQIKDLKVQRVHWTSSGWEVDGETFYGVDQTHPSLWIDLEYPQAVLVTLPHAKAVAQ
jgi:lysozyme family protein